MERRLKLSEEQVLIKCKYVQVDQSYLLLKILLDQTVSPSCEKICVVKTGSNLFSESGRFST